MTKGWKTNHLDTAKAKLAIWEGLSMPAPETLQCAQAHALIAIAEGLNALVAALMTVRYIQEEK